VTLVQRVWLLLLVVLALAIAGAMAVNLAIARETLQAQVRLGNADDARMLALVLSQQNGDAVAKDLAVRTMAETGRYRSIRFVPADGAPPLVHGRDMVAGPAPGWFRRLLPLDSPPGTAPVGDRQRALGRVEVAAHVEPAYTSLWRAGSRSLLWLLGVAGAALLLARVGVRRLQAPLDATVAQAQALSAGRFVTVPEPRLPELQRLTAAMNQMVLRVREQFGRETEQVDRWRRQAHEDALTGLAHRAHFIDRLGGVLQREDGAERGALVLVRALALDEANRELGRTAVDHALRGLAEVLRTYADRVPTSVAGRLNGADFALFVPAGGVAMETAEAMAAALRAGAAGRALRFAIGAVELRRGAPPARWLARADAALAQAELGAPWVPVLSDESAPPAGEQVWREQLLAALLGGRAELAEFPVRAADGSLLHLECPLRLRLMPEDPPQVAARWLPLAVRARLTARADLEALRLALAASAGDDRPRCVNVAAASLADAEFAARAREALADRPDAARRLWLDLPEGAAADRFRAVQELARQLRPMGVRVGLEHAGERLHRVPRLYELGLDYVKLDAAVCTALAGRDAAQEFLRHTVQMLAGVGIVAIAEGVTDDDDARLLLACGLGAITGPWASRQT
jgi:EAL domain-containing protein (putative c-di-GMP-specific phosphodiesterase class I)/GGDEF domain-containing protein